MSSVEIENEEIQKLIDVNEIKTSSKFHSIAAVRYDHAKNPGLSPGKSTWARVQGRALGPESKEEHSDLSPQQKWYHKYSVHNYV